MSQAPKQPKTSPFIIFRDTAEQQGYTFDGLTSASGEPVSIIVVDRCLQRHPHSLGDYSSDVGFGKCHVERKSMADAYGTFLGFNCGRRERFECELANLAELPAALVLVECSFADLVANAPETPRRSAKVNSKTIYRTVLAWQQDFHTVQWQFCDGRRLAEMTCFRWLERYAKKQEEAEKAAKKAVKQAQLLLNTI